VKTHVFIPPRLPFRCGTRREGSLTTSSFQNAGRFVKHTTMADDEMEDYGFEYSDEDPEEEDVDVENQYYNSKGTYGPFYIVFFLGF